ncbi:hypothetical protein BJ322DRAFT_997880 [Thelephora terrestris]|uniref:non-specific serine/threonine protein kinase n=1 Tax=Thelephora terrestris TaxID=56493 RepID=A0A9P6LC08_9AGAM|nr:hypothetical protein BJ322DRAFT_997880 [Thelephora terrestris]
MLSTAFPSASSSQYFGINVHQGAVDPSTVTSAPPTEVMKHVLGVLQGMGVVITEESKFRLRCVRPLRRDSDASDRTTASEGSTNSDTIYGDQSEDSGGEVRFSVELTEISGLKSTYSLDIRRLKGPLRSYKYMYDSLRE